MRAQHEVIWTEPARWTGQVLSAKLRKALKGRVEQAFLFGSHARGTATLSSDIDLLLVARTQLPWPERGRPFLDLMEQFGAVDLLVYTPLEWRNLMSVPTGFLEKARSEWKVLF